MTDSIAVTGTAMKETRDATQLGAGQHRQDDDKRMQVRAPLPDQTRINHVVVDHPERRQEDDHPERQPGRVESRDDRGDDGQNRTDRRAG